MTSTTQPRTSRHLALLLSTVLAVVGILTVGSLTPEAEAATAPRAYLVNARTAGQTAAAQKAAVKTGGQVVQAWPQIGVIVVRSTRAGYAKKLMALRDRSVLSVGDARNETARDRVTVNRTVAVSSPGRRITATATKVGKADPLAPRQKHLAQDRAVQAQKLTPGSSSVVVGVLDTGVDDRHRDLAPNFSAADSVDCTAGGRPNTAKGAWRGSDSHGTHVAGTIAAARNGYGVTGMAPGAHVASVKVVNGNGESFPEYIVCGLVWSGTRQLAVTNTSLNLFDLWCGELNIGGPALTSVNRAIAYANKRGVVQVQSAGNASMDVSWQRGETCHDPLAESPLVVNVASVNAKGRLSGFSSFGKGMVDIAAPGEAVYATTTGNRFTTRTGTSQAAPQVAGTIALMRSRNPKLSVAQITQRLTATTKAPAVKGLGSECTGTPRKNSCTGAGQLDSYAAVRAA